MRVTNGMIRNNSLNALYNNMGRLDTLYTQMSTLKKIQRPSDDPIIAGRSLKLRINILESEQYKNNTDEATSWMSVTETALSNITEIIKDIRTKCVQASTDTLGTDDREKLKTDIEQLWSQLQQESNVTYAGRYVFSGYKTNQPVMLSDGTLNPEVLGQIDGQNIRYEVGVGSTIDVNTLGMDKLMSQFFADIKEIKDALDSHADGDPLTNEDLHALFSKKIGDFDKRLSTSSEMTADLGSKMNRLQYTATRLTDDKTNFTELLSKTEDVDLEEIYTEFNAQYAVYQSALQATSKVIMNTLADFLR